MAVKTKRKQPKPPSIQGILTRFYGTMLPPKQQRKQARRETNLALQDSMRQLRTTYQRERERGLREQYAQGTYAGLLSGFGAPGSSEAQSIRDAYARAAGLSQAEAQGFIDPTVAQQGANIQASQATAQNLAGYTGDVAAITPGAATGAQQPGVNAMVLSYLNSLPRGTFAAQAESAAKGLGRAGAEAGGQFALRQAQMGQDLRELRDQYTMAVQDLQAKRPGLLQEALGRQTEGQRQDIATLISALSLQGQLGNQAFSQQLDVREQGRKEAATRADILAAMGLSPKGTLLPNFYRAPDGSVRKIPYGSRVGKGGKLVQDPNIPRAAKGQAQAKETQDRNRYLENVRADMLRAAQNAPLQIETEFSDITGRNKMMSRAQARQYLMSNFGQDAIRRYPGQSAAIKKMVEQVLTSLGFKK